MGLFAVLMGDRVRRLPQGHLAGALGSPDAGTSAWWPARVDQDDPGAAPSDGPGAASEDASRSGVHYKLYWEPGAPTVVAGDRLEAAGPSLSETLEVSNLVTPHRGVGPLPGVLLYTAEAVRLADLYPLAGDLEELGGALVTAAVPVGLWRAADGRVDPVGTVYDFDAEVPWDFRDAVDPSLHPNRQLRVDGAAYRIVGSSPRETVPRVVLRLRRVRPGG